MFSSGMLPQGVCSGSKGQWWSVMGAQPRSSVPGHQDQSWHWSCALLSSFSWFYPLSLIASREQKGMETRLKAPRFRQLGCWTPANEGRKWMSAHGQSAPGIHPSLPSPAHFLVFPGVVFTLPGTKVKTCSFLCLPQGLCGSGGWFIQQEKEFYWDSLKGLLCSSD